MDLSHVDWLEVTKDIEETGYAKTLPVLKPQECRKLISLYDDDGNFRSRIEMERYRFGVGEYKYFADPLPPVVQSLRDSAYPALAAIANAWLARTGKKDRYPETLEMYLKLCAKQGQTKPTPLLLHYQTGGYNCLHQDLYGELVFPLQITSILSTREEYEGGEFLLVEQRPRMQSRGEAIHCDQGELIIFPVRYRPVAGARGDYQVNMRHGVSRIRAGERYSLGVIFHNAK
jgi:hypothetical protein